jgi:TctA family transporter
MSQGSHGIFVRRPIAAVLLLLAALLLAAAALPLLRRGLGWRARLGVGEAG